MFEDNETPRPADELRRLHWLWLLALATPALYMLIGLAVGHTVFASKKNDGFWRLAPDEYRWVMLGVAGVAMALTAWVLWLRTRRAAHGAVLARRRPGIAGLIEQRQARDEAIRRYRFLTFLMFSLCDLIAFLGLLLYLIQGDALSQGVLSALAWLAYAFSRPMRPEDVRES